MKDDINKNKGKFYTLKYDTIFKNVFNNESTLKRLLEETLDLKINEITSINTEMQVETYNEKRKVLDLVLNTDQGIINVEVNNGIKPGLDKRNFLFLCKLASSSLNKEDDYTEVRKHIQLNLTWNLHNYNKDIDITNRKKLTYYMMEETTHELLNDFFKVVVYNMDYYINKWYNMDIEEENPFMLLLAAKDINEMDKISKGDKLMEDMTKEVKKLNVDPTYYKDLVIENEEEKFYRTAIKQGYKDGVEKGIEQGIEQGIKQGSYDSKVQIVKNMLKYSIKIDDISNITGLSIEDINDIKKQII